MRNREMSGDMKFQQEQKIEDMATDIIDYIQENQDGATYYEVTAALVLACAKMEEDAGQRKI